MLITTNTNFISCRNISFSDLFIHRANSSRKHIAIIAFAGKKDLEEKPNFPLKVSRTTLAQSAIGIFSLGFIDAGYSGDWSRIGVISEESERVLKIAAFLVVPLCVYFIYYLSKKIEN